MSVTVFFPSKAALAVTVTVRPLPSLCRARAVVNSHLPPHPSQTDCNVDTFLRAIIAQALSPADQQVGCRGPAAGFGASVACLFLRFFVFLCCRLLQMGTETCVSCVVSCRA